jgi:hypothetical protein
MDERATTLVGRRTGSSRQPAQERFPVEPEHQTRVGWGHCQLINLVTAGLKVGGNSEPDLRCRIFKPSLFLIGGYTGQHCVLGICNCALPVSGGQRSKHVRYQQVTLGRVREGPHDSDVVADYLDLATCMSRIKRFAQFINSGMKFTSFAREWRRHDFLPMS